MTTKTENPTPTEAIVVPANNQQLAVLPTVIEGNAVLLPNDEKRVEELAAKLKIEDGQTVLAFGADVQRKMSSQADQIMENVRSKDSGPAGQALNELVTQVRALNIEEVTGGKGNPIGRIINWFVNPLRSFIQRYESTSHQIESVVAKLEGHAMQLNRDIVLLDNLFKAAVDQFHDLELHILAGEKALDKWNREIIPQLQAKAQSNPDSLIEQQVRDALSARNDLERRIQDLRLTRTATLQSLPQIRLIQEVDKSLAGKIQSSILTTIPIWKAQIAMAITLYRQQESIATQKKVADTTNEMLRRNADLIQQNNADARKEIERGVIDIETLRDVNQKLLATINESIQITQEARRKRVAAASEMLQIEANLKAGFRKANQVS